jgi:GNAT superfamily N-acetyltransferase
MTNQGRGMGGMQPKVVLGHQRRGASGEIAEELLSGLWVEMRPLLEAHWARDLALQGHRARAGRGGLRRPPRAGCCALLHRCRAARAPGRLRDLLPAAEHALPPLAAGRQDVLFLHPDYRRGMAGVTLIRVAETRLRAEGVQVIYHHVKRTNRVGELLERLGYEHVDVYAKRLDKKE